MNIYEKVILELDKKGLILKKHVRNPIGFRLWAESHIRRHYE